MASPSSPIQVVEQPQQIELNVRGLEGATSPNSNTPPSRTPKQVLSSLATNPTTGTATDKTLSSITNLAQLLPTGTVLAFESLSSSFTNNGNCVTSNKYLTVVLIYFCLIACVILTFTDSVTGTDGKLYQGIATFKGFYVFNFSGTNDEATQTFPDLQKLRIKIVDFVHAFFTGIVFLAVAFSESSIQNCLFKGAGKNTDQLLINLPLGAVTLSSFVFLIFPTTRKGIGFSIIMPQKSQSHGST